MTTPIPGLSRAWMRISFIAWVVFCVSAFNSAGWAQKPALSLYARSYAVVVGVSRYPSRTWPDLAYARKDAEAMTSFLRRQGFEVFSLMDEAATAEAIISIFEDQLAPRLRKDDRVLVFFSGHGDTQTLGGKDFGYLVPHDGTSKRGSLISMETLRSLSDKMGGAKHQAFIIDACFGGLFAPTKARFAGIDKRHPRYIREITRRNGRQFLTAGGKGQQVLAGGPKGYSYFTGYLLEALQDGLGDLNGDGYVTLSEAATYLVPRATNEYQTPGMGTLPGHGLGDFVFLAPGGPKVAGVKPVGSNDGMRLGLKGTAGNRRQETLFWQSIKDSRNAEDFHAYLETFPNGTFAALAQIRIRQLGGSPASSPAPSRSDDIQARRGRDPSRARALREQGVLPKEPEQTSQKNRLPSRRRRTDRFRRTPRPSIVISKRIHRTREPSLATSSATISTSPMADSRSIRSGNTALFGPWRQAMSFAFNMK